MTKYLYLSVLLFCAVALNVISVWRTLAAEESKAAKPNILLVLSDDHSMPHLGAYGSRNCIALNLTPNLDRFAKSGLRFNRAYTAAPQCAPSRISIFAGRSPVGLGVTRFSQPARANVPLFTDLLRKQGYWTGMDGRHQHLDGKSKAPDYINRALIDMRMRGESFENRFDHFVRAYSTKNEKVLTVGDRLKGILSEVPTGKPWFLYFGFSQPHRPWGTDHEGIDPSNLVLPPDWPDVPALRLDYARFLADLRDLDTGFGILMKALEDAGAVQNTLVIFMGDNGEALLRGKGTVQTRGIHVPLLLRWPDVIKAGQTSDTLVSGIDLAPTILSIAGGDYPKFNAGMGMTGVDISPVLRGEKMKERAMVFAERGWHAGPLTRSDGLDLARSVTTKQYHFIYNAIPERERVPVDMVKRPAWDAIVKTHKAGKLSALQDKLHFELPRPIFELYDLKKDPYSLNNLAGKKEVKAIELKLRQAMDVWMIRENDYLPLPSDVVKYLNK